MGGLDKELCGNSAGSPALQSCRTGFVQSRQHGEAMTNSGMLKFIAGLSCIVLLSIVTLHTVYWSDPPQLLAYGLPIILMGFIISAGGIVASWCWRNARHKMPE